MSRCYPSDRTFSMWCAKPEKCFSFVRIKSHLRFTQLLRLRELIAKYWVKVNSHLRFLGVNYSQNYGLHCNHNSLENHRCELFTK